MLTPKSINMQHSFLELLLPRSALVSQTEARGCLKLVYMCYAGQQQGSNSLVYLFIFFFLPGFALWPSLVTQWVDGHACVEGPDPISGSSSDDHKLRVPGLRYNWWRLQAWDALQDSTNNSSTDKAETSLERQEYFSQLQDTTDALPCHIHLAVCLWIMDPYSRAPKWEEDKADRGRGGKTTLGNGQTWSLASPWGQWTTGKNGENWLQNHL